MTDTLDFTALHLSTTIILILKVVEIDGPHSRFLKLWFLAKHALPDAMKEHIKILNYHAQSPVHYEQSHFIGLGRGIPTHEYGRRLNALKLQFPCLKLFMCTNPAGDEVNYGEVKRFRDCETNAKEWKERWREFSGCKVSSVAS